MYPHFIELHSSDNNERMLYNIDHIVKTYDPIGDRCTPIYTGDGYDWSVRETYDEVKQLILDSGALINKGDPRLETKAPLTLKDLQGMLGEPVWNSNNDQWALVKEITEENVVLVYKAASWIIADEDYLIRFPLYRMKVKDAA